MNALALLLLLVVLVAHSVIELRPAARTPGQIAARIAAAPVRGRLGWLAAVLLIAPIYAAAVAARTGLWFTLVLLAWATCALTTILAMDGRAVRIARTAGGRA
ncbi:hypothetical protein [Nonomuraea sp. NPDC046570]|uniref:hypothetical protein n=1 Tax=Nonomuraea sp. NPDC046570 TaxID=3155255 RepID=UPI00340A940D